MFTCGNLGWRPYRFGISNLTVGRPRRSSYCLTLATNGWTAVTNLVATGISTNRSETIQPGWTEAFYRIHTQFNETIASRRKAHRYEQPNATPDCLGQLERESHRTIAPDASEQDTGSLSARSWPWTLPLCQLTKIPAARLRRITTVIRLDMFLPVVLWMLTRSHRRPLRGADGLSVWLGYVGHLRIPRRCCPDPLKLIPAVIQGLLHDAVRLSLSRSPPGRVFVSAIVGGFPSKVALMLLRVQVLGLPWTKVTQALFGMQAVTSIALDAGAAGLAVADLDAHPRPANHAHAQGSTPDPHRQVGFSSPPGRRRRSWKTSPCNPAGKRGIIGPTGSQTTLGRHLAGLHRVALLGHTCGRLWLNGRDCTENGCEGLRALSFSNPEIQLFGETVDGGSFPEPAAADGKFQSRARVGPLPEAFRSRDGTRPRREHALVGVEATSIRCEHVRARPESPVARRAHQLSRRSHGRSPVRRAGYAGGAYRADGTAH